MLSIERIKQLYVNKYKNALFVNDFTKPELFSGGLSENLVNDSGVNTLVVDDLTPTFTSPKYTGFQGYSTDGVNHYITDTSGIRKFDTNWVLILSNTSQYAGLTLGQNRMGDCQYDPVNDYLYCTVYGADINTEFSYCIYKASDLTLVSEHQVIGFPISGIGIDTINDELLLSGFGDSSKVLCWDKLTNTFKRDILLTGGASTFDNSGFQGIYSKGESFYLSSYGRDRNGDKVYVYDKVSGYLKDIHFLDSTDEAQGIDFSQDTLRVGIRSSSDGLGYTKYYKPTNSPAIFDSFLNFSRNGFTENEIVWPNSGVILTSFSLNTLDTDFQLIWDTDQGTTGNDLGSWVYPVDHSTRPRQIAARLLNGSTLCTYTLPVDAANKIYKYAFGWVRSGATALCKLYVSDGDKDNLILRDTQTQNWGDHSGHFFLNGGHKNNPFGNMRYYNFAFFNEELSLGELNEFDFNLTKSIQDFSLNAYVSALKVTNMNLFFNRSV